MFEIPQSITEVILSSVITCATTCLGAFLFFKSKKQQQQAEADKSTHEATKEAANAELHEVKVWWEIRRKLNDEIKEIQEKCNELLNENHELKKELLALKLNFEKFKNCHCGNENCRKKP